MLKILLPFLFAVILYSCDPPREAEDFNADKYYLHSLKTVVLTDKGIQQAKATWDSIRPSLAFDSTARGLYYHGMVSQDAPVNLWLSFSVDTSRFMGGPYDLKYQVLVKKPIEAPRTYFYVGDKIMPCMDKFEPVSEGAYSMMSDTMGTIAENVFWGKLDKSGFRFDTDRGPTQSLAKDQIKSFDNTLKAYKALAVLCNDNNREKAGKVNFDQ